MLVRLRKRIKRLGISYDRVATDDWDGFLSAFGEDNQVGGKEHTVGYRRKQLPLTASDQRGISKNLLFLQETVQPLKSF
jgi:hypothetical protein